MEECKHCEFNQKLLTDALAKIEKLEADLAKKRELAGEAMENVLKMIEDSLTSL